MHILLVTFQKWILIIKMDTNKLRVGSILREDISKCNCVIVKIDFSKKDQDVDLVRIKESEEATREFWNFTRIRVENYYTILIY